MSVDYWNNSGTDWSTASNWSLDAVPTIGELAVIQSGTAVADNVGTIDSSIFLGGSNTAAGLTLDNTNLGYVSTVVSDASGGTNLIDLTNRASNGNTNGQSNDLHGAVLATAGTTDINVEIQSFTTNDGLIAAANYRAPDTINLNVGYGGFENNGGLLAVGQGAFNIYAGFLSPGYVGGITNTGLIEAADGGTVSLIGSGPVNGDEYLGTDTNSGLIAANAGTVVADMNITQTATGTVAMANGSTLSLDGTLDDGSLVLSNSTLDLGLNGAIGFIGDPNAPTLELKGNTDTLDFGQAVQESFTAATDTLNIFTSGYVVHNIAEYKLGGSFAYSAADFSSSGSLVIFNAHPTS